MARALWTGSLSFGLVFIPVQLVPAVRATGVHFHLLSPDGKCRLRQKLFCPETGEEFDFAKATRGFEIAPGEYALVDKDEMAALRPEAERTIEITEFVELADIDPVYFDRPYYLLPGAKAEKPYQLLHDAVKSSGMVGLSKFVMRAKGYWAALRTAGDVLCLHTLRYADEVVSPADFKPQVSKGATPAKELQVAEQLIKAMVADFEPGKYRDEYSESLQKLVETKARGGKIAEPVEVKPAKPTLTTDLMDVLRSSVEAAQRGRSAESRGRPRRHEPPARKKTLAKRHSR